VPALGPAEEFALSVLVDLARVVPVDDPAADVVRLALVERPSDERVALAEWVANGWGIAADDGVVHVPRAALRAITSVAGAGAEQRSPAADRHGRVPSGENPSVAAGLERSPIISRAAASFRAAVITAARARAVRFVPAWPDGHRWAAAFTHDVDAVTWWPLFTAARGAELVAKGRIVHAARVAGAAARHIARRPTLDGVREVLELERALGITATWFVLCGTPTARTILAGDLTYLPESRQARAVFAAILEAGHEIGLHGSFATMDEPGVFEAQCARLAALIGQEPRGVRQHFLRMRPGATQHMMARAGFAYDATFGFPDRSGYRLGVADVVPAWSVEPATRLSIEEVPLVWMDRTLSKYRGVEDPAAWAADALAHAEICRDTGGLWVGLWHPSLTAPLGFPGAPAALDRIARTIVSWEPFVAPLDRIVRWRVARRSVRVERVLADGRVLARAGVPGTERLVLEDADGRAREEVASGPG
jgi:peptidoglycan/xylan/chitin deacetylase (PgdA/CDA1 family)